MADKFKTFSAIISLKCHMILQKPFQYADLLLKNEIIIRTSNCWTV